jgi:hypothetical protein
MSISKLVLERVFCSVATGLHRCATIFATMPGGSKMRWYSQMLMRLMTLAAFAACASAPAIPPSGFALSSPDFSAGGNLADSVLLNGLDCHGPNISPALQWSGAPAGTKGFALVLDDYEARGGDGFVHWAAYTSLRTRRGLCRTPAPSKVT